MQRTGKQENRIKELDALRGIAAIFVVLFHFTLHRPEAPSGFSLGVTGVDLFFIISGFVILMTLEKTGHWKDFVVSRFSRLYPGYWTCVTITAIAIAAHSIYHNKDLGNFGVLYLGNMTMLQKYLRIADMDGPYWTMIVEMLFYMLMLSIFLLRKLDMIEPIFALALPAIGLYSLDIFHVRFPQLSWILGGGFPLINHFPLFFSGILFYKIKVNGLSTTRLALLAACLGL
ncbi:MAG: hypothetical protein K0R82_2079, partial [Flavipsychrobacter sp.]|nr:hypothetical protein [Flavipsychrobacter sp.]